MYLSCTISVTFVTCLSKFKEVPLTPNTPLIGGIYHAYSNTIDRNTELEMTTFAHFRDMIGAPKFKYGTHDVKDAPLGNSLSY